MLFLQLSLNPAAADFKHSKWIEIIQAEFPQAETMEIDNFSEVFLYQQILKWVVQSKESLVLHIESIDPEATTGAMFRFLQDIFQKKKPICITLQGSHAAVEKYIKAFGEFTAVKTEREAVKFLIRLNRNQNPK